MSAIGIADYVSQLFSGSSVKVVVESDIENFKDRYPLLDGSSVKNSAVTGVLTVFAAVARCSNVVERHQPRVINLEYVGEVCYSLPSCCSAH